MAYISKEDVKVNFYRVAQVGYFKFAGKSAEFCSLRQLLDELATWCDGKTVELTGSFNDKGSGDQAPVYVADIQKLGGNYLLSTWNQTPLTGGKSASIPKSAAVGKAQPATSSVPNGNIPGYATYFWFIPDLNVFATVLLGGTALNGQQALRHYLQGFLAMATSYVRYSSDASPKLLGYAKDSGSPPAMLHPRFKTHPFVKEGAHARIISEAPNIRKVMRRTELNLQTADDLSLWQRILARTHLSAAASAQALSMPIEYEVATRVTADEVKAMIADFNASQSRHEDYGFELKATHEHLWLSKSLAKQRASLSVSRINDATVDAASLLAALQNQYTSLIGALQ